MRPEARIPINITNCHAHFFYGKKKLDRNNIYLGFYRLFGNTLVYGPILTNKALIDMHFYFWKLAVALNKMVTFQSKLCTIHTGHFSETVNHIAKQSAVLVEIWRLRLACICRPLARNH